MSVADEQVSEGPIELFTTKLSWNQRTQSEKRERESSDNYF